MPKFAANLTLLFNEVRFLERFEQAANSGFNAVEYLFPYDYSTDELRTLLDRHGLKQVLHNMPPGDWDAGERGIAILPDRVDEFKAGVTRTIEYASALGCPQVNCLAGLTPNNVAKERLYETLVENLQYAAAALKQHNIKLLVEAINYHDIPGFYLNTSRQVEQLIEDVGSDNLFFQYDIYHMQIMEGDLANTIERLLPIIPHMQLADNPGRHEPGTGEINYPWLFQYLDNLGYDGYIGCEYRPLSTTLDGLSWFQSL